MFDKSLLRSFAVLMVAVLWETAGQAATILTVPVGDAPNLDDTHGAGYGGVDYPYNIGMYEVTNAQYATFLNEVASSDPYELLSTI